jgi:hypothetical protein
VAQPLPLNEPSFAQTANLDYIMDSTQQEAQITLALADLANQEVPNFKGTPSPVGVNCTTLCRCYNSTQLPEGVCQA